MLAPKVSIHIKNLKNYKQCFYRDGSSSVKERYKSRRKITKTMLFGFKLTIQSKQSEVKEARRSSNTTSKGK